MGCTRCVRQNLACHYSIQKQMGRPRKRRNIDTGSREDRHLSAGRPKAPGSCEKCPSDPDQPVRNAFDMVPHKSCQKPNSSFISSTRPSPSAAAVGEDPLYEDFGLFGKNIDDVGTNITPPSDSPVTSTPFTIAESLAPTVDWTGYSEISGIQTIVTNSGYEKTSPLIQLPLNTSVPPPNNHYSPVNSFTSLPTGGFPVAPSCTCLPNLYLALSSLSTLQSLPINANTVETIQNATRTAHAVLYCSTCLQECQSGMQNVMLLATLLSAIGNSWSRILHAPAQDLARGFATDPATVVSTDSDLVNPWTGAKQEEWKRFAYFLIRQYVFGDAPPPGVHLPGICPFLSSTSSFPSKPPIIILQNLCNALERRQKTYHGLLEATGEFPKPCYSTEALSRQGRGTCTEELAAERITELENGKKEHICLKIVESIKILLAAVEVRCGRALLGAGHIK